MATSTPAPTDQPQGWGSFLWNKIGYETLPQDASNKSFYDLKAALPGTDKWLNMVSKLGHKNPDLADYKGKVVLIVNTASKCGFTPQYKGLQRLHEEYKDQGLVVLGFPCDQFGGQEPGNDQDIMQSDVNGANMNEVFAWIKSRKTSLGGTTTVKWNFEKALIGKDGQLINRYLSYTKPDSIKPDIEKALAA
ncbi:hypothetical protein QFC24_006501 [Naganishia onofrii]|uniref:Uncharacterized protein n=1 Tax=Naganishia onofrii TaxID=1851511 RepID=A0ACC2X1Z2_9TREE|nr:hypothetical protein QFC24_006501 [Naganishia onofrii]